MYLSSTLPVSPCCSSATTLHAFAVLDALFCMPPLTYISHTNCSFKQYSVNLSIDIGAEFGYVLPLDETRMHTLNINRFQLLDVIKPKLAFVTELADVRCITKSQRKHIVNIVQWRDRSDKLLEILTRRSVADFNNFINVLSKQQAHLVPLLGTDGGEAFLLV